MTDDLVGRLRLRRNHGDMMCPRMLLVNPDGDEAAARIKALEDENRKLREALAPFVDIGPQKGAWGVVSKKLTGMAPLTLTVTKDQFKALWALVKDTPHAD